jgi:flagellin
MTSILTNVAAMAALQTLRSIDGKMEDTQARVASGLRVGTASDNAAYWSIATTMRSDNAALSAVQDALGLGAAKVDTAYSAMETVVDVISEIKAKIVAASEAGVDKSKIQEEIAQLQEQLKNIATSASFSGENWLKADIGGATEAGTGLVVAGEPATKQIVGSFSRDAEGNVAVKTINVQLDEGTVLFDTSGGKAGLLDSEALKGARLSGKTDTNGDDIYVKTVAFSTSWVQNDDVWVADGGDTDTANDTHYVMLGGAFVLSTANGEINTTGTNVATAGDVGFAKDVTVAALDITKIDEYKTTLGLGAAATEQQVMAALLSFIDEKLEATTSATAALGSISMRIQMQEDFASKLTDSIDSGIGRLVDADMNEESTRLKALQTQQQLGIQALSIANTNSENILSLFRQ